MRQSDDDKNKLDGFRKIKVARCHVSHNRYGVLICFARHGYFEAR
jgi:hypothetical protein